MNRLNEIKSASFQILYMYVLSISERSISAYSFPKIIKDITKSIIWCNCVMCDMGNKLFGTFFNN